jgi:hypothetical protein
MDPITEQEVMTALPPLECNSFLRQYVEYASWCTDAHMAYHLLTGLVVLTQTVPIDYSFPYGEPMYTNLYVLCVGPSAHARKSHSVSIARNLLNDALPNSVGEVPGSKENLVDALNKNPRQVIVYSEFGNFLSSTKEGYLSPLKTAYTEAYDCSELGRGLVKKQDTRAKWPRLSIMAGSTLDYMEQYTTLPDWTGGFMGRFMVMLTDRQRTFTVPPGTRGRERLVQWIQALNSYCEMGVPRGRCQGFDDAARALWDQWYVSIDQPQIVGGRTASEVGALVSRAHSHALRVAMLLAWDYGTARNGGDWYITPRELQPALAITALHLRSVQSLGATLSSNRDQRDRRAVLSCFHKPEVPVALGQIVTESKLLLRRVKEIIESLAEEGYIESVAANELRGVHFKRVAHKGWRRDPGAELQFDGASNVVPFRRQESESPSPNTSLYDTPGAAVAATGTAGDGSSGAYVDGDGVLRWD